MSFGENIKAFFTGKPRQTRWQLADAVARHALTPETFPIPSSRQIGFLQVNDLVKLVFESREETTGLVGERMWVTITDITENGFVGILSNDPIVWEGYLHNGQMIHFSTHHIIDILTEARASEPYQAFGIWNDTAISLPGKPV